MSTRAIPRFLRLLLVCTTAAALLAMPFQALAVKGDGVVVTIDARMETVSTNGLMAFDVSFTNGGNTTITQPRFDGTASGATYIGATVPCDPVRSDSVRCLFGNVAAGVPPIEFTVFFRAPSGAGSITLDGAFTSDARQGNKKSASSDTWSDDDDTTTSTVSVAKNADFYASWQRAHGVALPVIPVGDGFQNTKVAVPPFTAGDYPSIVQQVVDSPTFDCEGLQTSVGKTVELTIAGGNRFDDEAPLRVTIEYSSAAAGTKSPGNLSIGHVNDAGTCKPVPRGCSSNPAPCYDAAWSGSGRNKSIIVTIQLPTNGKVRGY